MVMVHRFLSPTKKTPSKREAIGMNDLLLVQTACYNTLTLTKHSLSQIIFFNFWVFTKKNLFQSFVYFHRPSVRILCCRMFGQVPASRAAQDNWGGLLKQSVTVFEVLQCSECYSVSKCYSVQGFGLDDWHSPRNVGWGKRATEKQKRRHHGITGCLCRPSVPT